MVPWFIATGALVSFIALWLRTTQRELLPLWEGVQGAEKQVRLYGDLLGQSQEDLEKKVYMEERYDLCCFMYASQVRRYNESLQNRFNAPAAWILGYRSVPEVIEFDL
jgi:hypothetical protein